MQKEILDLACFAGFFEEGTKNLARHYKACDRINVFPMPDSDTGINAKSTLKKVLTDLRHKNPQKLSLFLTMMSDSFQERGLGNSGRIYAIFFKHLSEKLKGQKVIGPDLFFALLRESSFKTWDELEETKFEPVEGTILSVMKEAFAKCKAGSFEKNFEKAHRQAIQSVAKTKNRLPLLKRYGVVDAGALSFLFVIEGWRNFFCKKKAHCKRFDNLKLRMKKLPGRQVCLELVIACKKGKACESEIRKILSRGRSVIVLRKGKANQFSCHVHVKGGKKAASIINRFLKMAKVLDIRVSFNSRERFLQHCPRLRGVVRFLCVGPAAPLNLLRKYGMVEQNAKLLLNGKELKGKHFSGVFSKRSERVSFAKRSVAEYKKNIESLISGKHDVVVVLRNAHYSPAFAAAKEIAGGLKKVAIVNAGPAKFWNGLIALSAAEQARVHKGKSGPMLKWLSNFEKNTFIHISAEPESLYKNGEIDVNQFELASRLTGKVVFGNRGKKLSVSSVVKREETVKEIARLFEKNLKSKSFNRVDWGIIYGKDCKKGTDLYRRVKGLVGKRTGVCFRKQGGAGMLVRHPDVLALMYVLG